MDSGSWPSWRIEVDGREVAIVRRSRMGYWLTPSPTSGVFPSTSLHASDTDLRDALVSRFGGAPDSFRFATDPNS